MKRGHLEKPQRILFGQLSPTRFPVPGIEGLTTRVKVDFKITIDLPWWNGVSIMGFLSLSHHCMPGGVREWRVEEPSQNLVFKAGHGVSCPKSKLLH